MDTATDFELPDHLGRRWRLGEKIAGGPVLLVRCGFRLPPRPRCGGTRWVGHGHRARRLHGFEGERQLRVDRVACSGCGKTLTLFPAEVVPGFRYARSVIETALRCRAAGLSWERCAVTCTADGLVSTSVIRRWAKRFPTGLHAHQPVAPFRSQVGARMLGQPAESRAPDPTQEDPWARSPPAQL